ncbi:NAD(P)-dependent oxidoreductase [Devosia ginsengisoli]|uniref:NAD-dependent epimerase/dehydratase family protein n=1 Tax=Devosia ginsengisoli TaxID=400770 RepID=UPI0026EB3FD1|nr:NAD(P)-dependent oxidoreductase [Devosia ginsengisoli]MCR6670749.1 NAD(P)-dependent oxidoreductase [Devosia ginsengisoli]
MGTILVTGGTGMVAQHVAEAAMARGHSIRMADMAWPEDRIWIKGAEQVGFDIRDRQACRRYAEGALAIIHCAAVVGPIRSRVDPSITLDVNVVGTANLLEAARESGARLINVSTATLYGNRPDLAPLSETDPTDPLTIYDGTKLMSETWCAAHRRTYGSDAASFRTGFVFGRGNQIGEYFLPRVVAGEAVIETAGGDHPCDFTYVVDLAEALVAAALAPALAHSVYNVTGGELRLRRDLAHAVRDLVPGANIVQAPGIDPQRHLRGACVLERAEADFGWTPRFTLESGMADWLERLSGLPERRPGVAMTRDNSVEDASRRN